VAGDVAGDLGPVTWPRRGRDAARRRRRWCRV